MYMKRILALILIAAMCLGVTACSKNEDPAGTGDNGRQTTNNRSDEDDPALEGDTEITVPAVMLQGEASEELTEEDKAKGYRSAVVNEDGSVTYVISKRDQKKLMDNAYREAVKNFKEMETETYASVQEVSYNQSLSNVTLVVDSEAFQGGMDSYSTESLLLLCATYQMYSGLEPFEIDVSIQIQDAASGAVVDTLEYYIEEE